MNRTMIVAGLLASALHVAVLTAIGSWKGAGHPDSMSLQPLRVSFVESTRPEAEVAEEEVESPSTPPVPAVEPPEASIADADEPIEDQLSVAKEAVESPSAQPDDSGADDPIENGAAEFAMSDAAEMVPAEVSRVAESAIESTEMEASVSLPVRPVVHRLLSPPPVLLMAMLTPALQRAASPPVKPTPAPVASTPAPQGGDRIEPVLEHRPKPNYPTVARRRGYEGTVVLRIEVLEDGSVGGVEIRQSSGHDVLDRQAERTIREQWRFRPGRLDGRTAALWIDIPIEFHLVDS